jgi:ABC-type Fe3+-hydroxamate transport system substrate-binding protein
VEQVLSDRTHLVRLLLTAALAAAACGPGASAPAAPDAAPARPAAPAPDAAPARRIVSLAPAFTETLIALGAADAVVGIGRFDPEIPGKPSLPRLGDTFDVSLETLFALRPDLVLVNSQGVAESLRPLASRITVLTPPTDRLADALALFEDLGRRTGHVDEATALSRRVRGALDASRARAEKRRTAGASSPKVLVVVQRRPLYAAGRTSFVAELLDAVGARNALDDVEQPWPLLSEEAAVARAPDAILDASEGDNATEAGRAALLESWSRFPSVPAVRDGRVLVIREDAIFRPGPRIPEALARLEAMLWPEERR